MAECQHEHGRWLSGTVEEIVGQSRSGIWVCAACRWSGAIVVNVRTGAWEPEPVPTGVLAAQTTPGEE